MNKNRPAQLSAQSNSAKGSTHPTIENPKPLIETIKGMGQDFLRIVCVLLLFIAAAVTHGAALAAGYKFGMLYSIANNGKLSGRADGNVYMRNGRIRGMKVPRLVRNSYTLVQRSNFGSLNSNWNNLTDAQRAAWNASDGILTTDRFGNQVLTVGKALYVALNRALANVGAAALTSPPIFTGAVAPTTITPVFSLAGGVLKVPFTPTPVPASTAYVVFATAPQTAGTTRPGQSLFRLIGVALAASASPVNLSTAYTTKNGVPLIGQRIFVQVLAVNTATGQQSIPIQASGLVTA